MAALEKSNNPAQYKFEIQRDKTDLKVFYVDLNSNDNSQSRRSISLAIINNNDIIASHSLSVNLNGKPVISDYIYIGDESLIEKSTHLIYTVTIENALNPSSGHLLYAFYKGEIEVSSFQETDFTGNDDLEFYPSLPKTNEETTYTMKVKFYEIKSATSNIFEIPITVHFNKLGGCRINSDSNTLTPTSKLSLTCGSAYTEVGYEIKVKFTDSPDDEYDFNAIIRENDVSVDLTNNKDPKSHTSITLTIFQTSPRMKTEYTDEVAVNLHGKPILGELQLSKPDQSAIQPNTELTFNVKITNAIDPSKGHIKYLVYQGDSIPTDDQLTGKDDTVAFDTSNNIATFEVNVPEGASSGNDYRVRVLFYEIEGVESDSVSFSSFPVHRNSLTSCHVADSQVKYSVDSSKVEFTCVIEKVGGYNLMAKINSGDQYTMGPLNADSEGLFSIDLSNKGITESGQKEIFFALVKDTEIGFETSAQVTLYGTPTLTKPVLKDSNIKIEPDVDIHFGIDVSNAVNPKEGKVECKIYKADSSANEQPGTPCNLSPDGSSYTLSLKAPNSDKKADYQVEVKFYEIQEKSATQTSDSITVYTNSINCHSNNAYNLNSESIELQCDDLFVQKNRAIKAKFNSQSSYEFTATPHYESTPATVSIALTGLDNNGPGQNNLQLAIVDSDNNVIYGPKDISIKLYGIPKLSDLSPVQQTEITQVKQKTSIKISVTITDAVAPVEGTMYYAFYESTQDKNQASYSEATGFTKSQDNSNVFTFTIKAPAINQESQKFNLAVKFQEQNGNPSQPLEYGSQVTVKSSTIDCELADTQAKYKIDASDIMLDCKLDLEDGHIFKAKIGEMTNNANDYTLPLTPQTSGGKTYYILNLKNQGETKSQTKLSFAVLAGSEGHYTIVKEDDAGVKLYGKPSLENLRLSTPSQAEIEKGKHLTYVVDIKNAITETAGTLKYGLYKDDVLVGDEKTMDITSVSESATFELDVPNDAVKDSTYQVKVTFNQIADEISDPASATFTVLANSISCTPQESQYQVDSTITLTCTIEKVGGYNLKAKVGKTSGVANDYNLDVNHQEENSQTYTINLGNAHISNSQTSIAIALVKEGAIGVEANVKVNLYGTPELTSLQLLSLSDRIQRNTELQFKIKITNAIEPSNIQYAFVKEDQSSTNPVFVDAKEFGRATEESMYTFKVTVPSDASDANYKVKIQFFEIQERTSNTLEQTVKVNLNRITGCALSHSTEIYTVKSSISFTCQSIFVEDGSELKAKLNNGANVFPTNIAGNIVSVNLQGNTDTTIKTSLTLVILSGTSEVATQTIDCLKLYGTPTLSIESGVTGSTNPIQRGTTLSLNLQIGNTFELESGKVKIALFKKDQLPSAGFGGIDPSKFTPSNPTNNKYKFDISVPNNADAGEYILRVQFVDNGKQESEYKDSTSINVKVNKLSCALKSNEINFGAQSSITFTCNSMIVGGKIKAKLGGDSGAANDFQITNENWQEGENVEYTLDLSKVQINKVYESVTFAIVDGEKVYNKAVIDNIHIIPTPEISDLNLVGENHPIHPGASLSFKLKVSKSYDITKGQIKAALFDASNTNQKDFTGLTAQSLKLTLEDNLYTFTFKVPETQTKNYYLIAQYIDVAKQNSNSVTFTKDIIVYKDEDFSLKCEPYDEKSKIIAISGIVDLKCSIKEPSFVTPKLRIHIGDGNNKAKNNNFVPEVGSIENNKFRVTARLNNNELAGDKVTAVLMLGSMEVQTSTVNIMVVAAPKVKSIVDINQGATYNYTQSITVKIDVEYFYKIEEAKIKYLFVQNKNTPLVKANLIQNKPEPINGSPNQYMLTIPIPESEKKGSNKYLGIEFTDVIGQKIAVYSEKKFTINYIVDVQPLKDAQNKVTVEKSDDFIRVSLTLSNLKDDWNITLQFGYKFDDLKMEILKKEHYKKSESSRKLFEVGPQKFDLEIPVPKDLSNGNHKLSVFVVNENKLQISEQSLFDVEIKKGDKSLDGKPGKPPLGIIVAVVVIVLIIIAVAIIVFIIYKKKSSNENNKEEEEVEKEDGETHMNIYDEGGTTLENALSVTATNADIFESGSGSEDNDNEEVHVEI